MILCECGCNLPVPTGNYPCGVKRKQTARFINGHFQKLNNEKAIEQFWSNIDKNGPVLNTELGACWLWKGPYSKGGYGKAFISKFPRVRGAHRLAYLLSNGDSELDALHKCDNPPCCNPSHLYGGDDRQNILDSFSRGRRTNRGESNPRSVLTEEQVAFIRTHAESPAREMRELFGVSDSLIREIRKNRCWK